MTATSIRLDIARVIQSERIGRAIRRHVENTGALARRAPHRDLLPRRARLRLA